MTIENKRGTVKAGNVHKFCILVATPKFKLPSDVT